MNDTFKSTDTAESVLAKTFFIVEATSFEQQQLWSDHSDESMSRSPLLAANGSPTVEWVQMNPGWIVQLGKLGKRPVNMSVNWARIDGRLVMFWYLCSQVADYAMAEKWLEKHFHGTYDNGHRRAETDASNFGHCLSAIREANKNR